MILILGGTTEGRIAAQVADQSGKPFYYSTRGDEQEIITHHGIRLTGGMDTVTMPAFCREHNIRLLIDAAHPFAEELHQTVADTSEQLGLPVVRYERIYPIPSRQIVWCNSYAEAIQQLEVDDIYNLLALTGVQSIAKLKRFWTMRGCHFRILDRESSRLVAREQGFPQDRIIYYHAEEDERELLQQLRPQAILIKESGLSGGFAQKVTAALDEGIRVYALRRPQLADDFLVVNGEHGLRRAIESLLPEFYPLRTGLSTGTCATAAVLAAAAAVFHPFDEINSVAVTLPCGEIIEVPVDEVNILPTVEHNGYDHLLESTATVIKDSGDDPDVTNGLPIRASFSFMFNTKENKNPSVRLDDYSILLCGGEGVGIVTLPGLGLELGAPAINATPRRMIEENLRKYLHEVGIPTFDTQFVVTISVPGGEEIAERTFNSRVGVVGGISIIGTSGIVHPFSSDAFVDAIRKEMEVAKATGTPRVVINSGAKSERYVRSKYPELPDQAFVHYGNFIGETLKIAAELELPRLTLGVMIGKAVKLAEGHLDTHSKKVVMNKQFLKEIAFKAGCSTNAAIAINALTLARELWTMLSEDDQKAFFTHLIALCHQHCAPLLPQGELTILLISEEGEILDE